MRSKKFLIVKLSSLGDIVHTLPFANRLKELFSNSQIDWLIGKKGVELLSLIDGINVYELNLKNILRLRKNKYDYVFDVQGLLKTAFISRFIGKNVIGFSKTKEPVQLLYDKKVNVDFSKHIIDLNLSLLQAVSDSNISRVNFGISKVKSKTVTLGKGKNVLILPTTTWASKMWSLNYWVRLIRDLSISFNVIISALKHESSYLEPLFNQLNSENIIYKNLVGKTSIRDLIYVIQNVDLVIGVDSGGLHLASAMKHDYGLPNVIGIYGPTSISRNGPYNMSENALTVKNLNCLGCWKKTCPLGHHKCMNDLVPEYVIDKVNLLTLSQSSV